MVKKGKFKVGDKIVELGLVFRVFKINKVKNSDGRLEKVIFFKPYFKNESTNGLTCSIPAKNIVKTKIRRPISKKLSKELKNLLQQSKNVRILPDLNKAKELLKTNDPFDTVRLLKSLSKEKNKSENFPKSKSDLLSIAVEAFAQEFALVNRITLKNAVQKINSALQI